MVSVGGTKGALKRRMNVAATLTASSGIKGSPGAEAEMRWYVSILILILLLTTADVPWAGREAYVIGEDKFKASNKEYPECPVA